MITLVQDSGDGSRCDRGAAMRLGWLGFHQEGQAALRAVLAAGHRLDCLITLREDGLARRSGAVDLAPWAAAYGVPLFRIGSINDADSLALLRERQLDVLFVIGWSQILRPEALASLRCGAVGSHASLLPHNRGSAPVNWCLIRGESVSGCTLLWLDPEVDRGDIIAQVSFPCTPYDTCATIYDKVSQANASMVVDFLEQLRQGRLPRRPQGEADEPILPRRRPEHGRIDWTQPASRLYDFIRALTRPYPGAFGWLHGTCYRIWNSALLDIDVLPGHPPGTVIGACRSPEPGACGQIVACGAGALVLLELETAGGELLRGAELSERAWQGMVWHDA